jgi:putative ABC transport system permease protein
MKLALRELRRRPGRFAVATGALTFIVLLLLFIGGLLDGLFLGSTGAIRAQQADVFVYSADAKESFLRSRITPELRAEVEAAPGVQATGGLGFALVGAEVPGEDDLADAAVIGYELAPSGVPAPPPPGQAWADERLKSFGVEQGQTLLLGPAKVPIEVAGFVKDTNYLLQGALWVEAGTWRDVQNKSRPDARVTDGVFQSLVAQGDGSPASLAEAIDTATNGQTSTLTKDEAVLSLPGTREQEATFNLILGITFVVAGIVVALFFALLTLERTALYGVLKAIGASSRQLVVGLLTQAVVVALVALAIGISLAFVLGSFIPPQVPLQFQPSRAVTTAVIIVIVAALGGLVSLRRVVRIDPASAIGSAS